MGLVLPTQATLSHHQKRNFYVVQRLMTKADIERIRKALWLVFKTAHVNNEDRFGNGWELERTYRTLMIKVESYWFNDWIYHESFWHYPDAKERKKMLEDTHPGRWRVVKAVLKNPAEHKCAKNTKVIPW